MGKKIRLRAKKPWIGYAGSTIQQGYGELIDHGYLLWKIGKKDVNVDFHVLSNPGPFVTLNWQGSVDATVEHALTTLPSRCRIRVRAQEHISQKDAQLLTTILRSKFDVIEVTFKIDAKASTSLSVDEENSSLERDDLRNADVLLRLMKSYYGASAGSVSEEEWQSIYALVNGYVASASANEDVLRNVKWSLRKISFENTFGYGEGNSIDFGALSGIVGIFGANRAGKSSIVGTIMYGLYNTTDRGSLKNLHVINVRKQFCSATSIINVGGVDYIIERQTVKNENKKGQVHAPTSLNVFRVNGPNSIDDLVGEQRTETEKVVRRLIGMPDDFMLTSLSAQEEINQFIRHGSTKRRQVLSKFLDVDVFDKMHELANRDAAGIRSQLKVMAAVAPDEISAIRARLIELDDEFTSVIDELSAVAHDRDALQARVHSSKNAVVVTEAQVNSQKSKVDALNKKVANAQRDISVTSDDIQKLHLKLNKISTVKTEYDVVMLRERVKSVHELGSNIKSTKHELDKETSTLKQQKKSLTILTEVPCPKGRHHALPFVAPVISDILNYIAHVKSAVCTR